MRQNSVLWESLFSSWCTAVELVCTGCIFFDPDGVIQTSSQITLHLHSCFKINRFAYLHRCFSHVHYTHVINRSGGRKLKSANIYRYMKTAGKVTCCLDTKVSKQGIQAACSVWKSTLHDFIRWHFVKCMINFGGDFERFPVATY